MQTLADAIQFADPQKVVDCLITLKANALPGNEWLNNHNHYKIRATNKLYGVHRAALTPPNPNDLKDYISASTLIHCLDGWSYLSQAMSSYLEGEDAGSLHLAYYAELRAVLSFLACQGIGVFDAEHYYLHNDGRCIKFNRTGDFNHPTRSGTHRISWSIMSSWSAHPGNAFYLLNNIKVKNISLSDWLDVFLGQPATVALSSTAMVGKLFRIWCMDITKLEQDRNVRNFSSYRPQRISPYHLVDFSDRLRSVWNLNQLLEPSGPSSKFTMLDILILKEVLVMAFRDILSSAGDPYDKRIKDTCNALGVSDDSVISALQTENDIHEIFREGSLEAINEQDQIFPISVICRALLMLRIASMASDDVRNQAGIVKNDLAFWLSEIMNTNGLGDFASTAEISDLWQDKKDAIAEIGVLLSGAPVTMTGANRSNGFEIWQLKKMQSAGLWGLGF